jgi:hypothetical protein
MNETQNSSGSGASIGGWICWTAGIAFVFVPLPTFFIYGPLFLVAFILGIVAIAQKRLGSGIGLLLATIIGSPIAVAIAWCLGLLLIGSAAKADLDARRDARQPDTNILSAPPMSPSTNSPAK